MLTHGSVVEGWNVITDTIGVKSLGPAENNVYCVCNIISFHTCRKINQP